LFLFVSFYYAASLIVFKNTLAEVGVDHPFYFRKRGRCGNPEISGTHIFGHHENLDMAAGHCLLSVWVYAWVRIWESCQPREHTTYT